MIKNIIKSEPVFTSYLVRDNSFLVVEIAKLYLKDVKDIADITWGKGVFWKRISLKKYNFCRSDLLTCPETPYDFRKLPYEDESFDVVVFDPPYAHNPGKMMVNENYKNKETTGGFYHKDIINLYFDGMKEGIRILRTGGMLWVKCKDEIESSFQRWSHIEIYNIAISLGLYAKDFFILIPANNPYVQHKKQQHARKNHSYFWIFKKPSEKDIKQLKKFGIWENKRKNVV